MKEFLLVFRSEHNPGSTQPTPEQMQASMKKWQDWLGGVAAQNKLVNAGNPLEPSGVVMKADTSIVNGPYVETKEAVGGFTIIRAASFEEAAELSKGCPVLETGGSIEIRPVIPFM